MNAVERVAWLEVVVTTVAMVASGALIPWLGDGAWGAFGIMGLLGLSALMIRRKPGKVVMDERDHQILFRASWWGVHLAWQFLFLSLIALVLWSSAYNEAVVPTRVLTWLVWLQFAACYLVKGLYTLLQYRGMRHAT